MRMTGTGFATGRPAYHVTCTTCSVVLHEKTTGPEYQINNHIRDRYNARIAYGVRIVALSGNQQGNERCWPIGSFLHWRDAIIEDNHGPGGFEGYRPGTLYEALFMSLEQANGAIKRMATEYPGVECALVKFTETK